MSTSIIFANNSYIPLHTPGLKGWAWTVSNNGWITDKLGWEWLSLHFEPKTRPSDGSRRLLIVDGHGSHVQARCIAFCMERSIDLMVLPAHTSHMTQPLDVGVFQPLKPAMGNLIHTRNIHITPTMGKAAFIDLVRLARLKSIKAVNIESGF